MTKTLRDFLSQGEKTHNNENEKLPPCVAALEYPFRSDSSVVAPAD